MANRAPASDLNEPAGLDLEGLPSDALVGWLKTMTLIREFEQACEPLALRGLIPAGIHSSAGQEAVAVGSIRALHEADIVCGTHRTHHHALAKGVTPASVMAELFGRATGCCGGRGGTMHLADPSIGYFGGNGIVGAGVGIAMGAALAAQLKGDGQVALGFVGDGGANVGRLWESLNLAAIWKLPLVVVCENNLYAVETRVDRVTAGGSIARRAAAFGVPAVEADGQDVGAVYRATREAAERARLGGGPGFIEAFTYRFEGHNTGQIITYRTADELEAWRRRDPLEVLRAALERDGRLSPGAYQQLVEETRAEVTQAVAFATASPWPDPSTATRNVTGLGVAWGAQE